MKQNKKKKKGPLKRLQLRKVHIDPALARKMPQDELTVFLTAQVMYTELHILGKLLSFQGVNNTNQILNEAELAQRHFLMLLLAGKLFEGWEFVNKCYFGKVDCSRKYSALIDPKGRASLENLKSYFNKKSNAIKNIRNTFGFHYSEGATHLSDKFFEYPGNEPSEIYIAESAGNCLFALANRLLVLCCLDLFDELNTENRIQRYQKEIIEVRGWFLEFFTYLIFEIFKNNFPNNSEEVFIPNPVDLRKIKLPYFVI